MAPAPVASLPVPRPVDVGGRPLYVPTPDFRMLVEIMAMAGFSKEAICRELVKRGEQCAAVDTLNRAFEAELAYGKERRLTGYIVRVHSVAMGNSPAALSALKYLIGKIGGPQWAGGDLGVGDDAAAAAAAAVAAAEGSNRRIYIPARLPEPEDEGPVIEGETEEAA